MRCSISLRILRRVSIVSVSCVRPSASKALDGSKIFEAGLVEVDDARRFPARGRWRRAPRRPARGPGHVVAALLVHFLERHLGGDGAQRGGELAFEQVADAVRLQRAPAERLRGGGDRLAASARRARRTRR